MDRRMLAIVAVVVVCVLALLMTLAQRKVSPRSGPTLSDSVYRTRLIVFNGRWTSSKTELLHAGTGYSPRF
jgi:hypothetical protein